MPRGIYKRTKFNSSRKKSNFITEATTINHYEVVKKVEIRRILLNLSEIFKKLIRLVE